MQGGQTDGKPAPTATSKCRNVMVFNITKSGIVAFGVAHGSVLLLRDRCQDEKQYGQDP